MLNKRKRLHIKFILWETIFLLSMYISLLLYRGVSDFSALIVIIMDIVMICFPIAVGLLINLVITGIHWYSKNKSIATKEDRTALMVIVITVLVFTIISVIVIREWQINVSIYLNHQHYKVGDLKVQ